METDVKHFTQNNSTETNDEDAIICKGKKLDYTEIKKLANSALVVFFKRLYSSRLISSFPLLFSYRKQRRKGRFKKCIYRDIC